MKKIKKDPFNLTKKVIDNNKLGVKLYSLEKY